MDQQGGGGPTAPPPTTLKDMDSEAGADRRQRPKKTAHFTTFEVILLGIILVTAVSSILTVLVLVVSCVKGASAQTLSTSQDHNKTTLDLVRAKREASVPKEELRFEAYDCTSPSNLTAVSVEEQGECHAKRLAGRQSHKKQYRLLQLARRHRFEVYECQATRSREAFVCGNYGHSTIVPDEQFYDQPYTLTPDECKKAMEQRLFDTPHKHPDWFRRHLPDELQQQELIW